MLATVGRATPAATASRHDGLLQPDKAAGRPADSTKRREPDPVRFKIILIILGIQRARPEPRENMAFFSTWATVATAAQSGGLTWTPVLHLLPVRAGRMGTGWHNSGYLEW